MTTPDVQLKTSRQEDQFAAIVNDVRVRFKRLPPTTDRTWQWDCDQHGKHMFSTCEHEKAALAEYRKKRNND